MQAQILPIPLLYLPGNRYLNDVMAFRFHSIYETRRRNLLYLIKSRFGGINARFAESIEMEQSSRISRLLKNKNMGKGLARDIELRLGLPDFWMDQPHDMLAALETLGLNVEVNHDHKETQGQKPETTGSKL